MRARLYQARHADELVGYFSQPPECGRGRDALICYCTGGGKTVLGNLVAARTRLPTGGTSQPGRYSHWIFTAPSDVLVNSFKLGEDIFDGNHCHTPPSIKTTDEDHIDIGKYLAMGDPQFALATSHISNTLYLPHFLEKLKTEPHLARGKMCFIDEAHRSARNNKLDDFRQAWVGAGGDVLWSTATPWDRDDGRPTVPRDVFTVRRTMAEQMADGFAPRTILSELVTVDCAGDPDAEDIAVPIEPEPVAQKLVEHMREEGWPKSIVRVKTQGSHDTNGGIIVAILRALLSAGRRVYVASAAHEGRRSRRGSATPVGSIGQHHPEILRANGRIIEDLRRRARQHGWEIDETGDLVEVRKYERLIKRYEDSCVDVIIGIHSIVEGFDWPLCSHSYLIGMPRGLLPVIQVLGRSARPRLIYDASGRHVPAYVGYPRAWEDRSKIVFVTARDPDAKDALLAQMLETCGYLSTFHQSVVLGAFRRSLNKLRIEGSGDIELDPGEVQTFTVSDERANEIDVAWNHAKLLLEASVTHPSKDYTVSDKIKITKTYLGVKDGLSQEAISGDRQLHEDVRQIIFLNYSPAREAIQDLGERVRESGKEPVEAFRGGLRRLLDEFEKDTTFFKDTSLTSSERMLALSSETITKYGERLAPIPPSKQQAAPGSRDPYSAIEALVRSR